MNALASRMGKDTSEPQERTRILLVDDNPDNLFSLNAVLEPLNEEILMAHSGEEALRLCLEHDFAAILLDVRMPRLDGFETAEFIRARKRSRHTPILFLTAYRSDEQLFRGYDLGAVDFLFRPVVPEVLQSKVKVFVELSRNNELLQRRAAELARAEQKFRSLLESAPDAKVISRLEGEIVLINSRTETLFGYPREELVGRNIRTLVPSWELDGEGAASESSENAVRVVRLTAIRSDGTRFPAEIAFSPLRTDDEGILIINALRDISDHVQAEEKIRRVNTELEKRVAERTAELMRSNEALRQFAWAASHDLQEPLRMVISFSELLKQSCEDKLDEKEKQVLALVDKNAARMESLLAALRQYMQISDSDCGTSQPSDCDRLLDSALQNLSGAIHEARAVIIRDPLPTIPAPAVLILQLFQNLIGNAVKYRREEPPQIHVSAARREQAWVFSVQDNGIGIEPQFLSEYVFGVFKRIHHNRYSGAGIGLAICKAAVERIGGRIWAESEVGCGSTFYFSVPDGAA
jgi:PAS domain S-box-containing protein